MISDTDPARPQGHDSAVAFGHPSCLSSQLQSTGEGSGGFPHPLCGNTSKGGPPSPARRDRHRQRKGAPWIPTSGPQHRRPDRHRWLSQRSGRPGRPRWARTQPPRWHRSSGRSLTTEYPSDSSFGTAAPSGPLTVPERCWSVRPMPSIGCFGRRASWAWLAPTSPATLTWMVTSSRCSERCRRQPHRT